MLVKELIEQLSKYDWDKDINIRDESDNQISNIEWIQTNSKESFITLNYNSTD